MDLYTISIILFIFFLILLSGFFSGTETALTAVSKPKIHQLEKRNPRAKIVSFLKLQKEKLIGTLLLGNNLVNTLATAIATSLIINYSNDNEKAVIYSTCIMTALILIFGEVLPKTIAINKAEKFSLLFAPTIKILVKILSPFTYLIHFFTRGILKLFKFQITSDIGTSEDELRGAIDLHAKSEGSTQEKDMLKGILDLDDLQVNEIMTHRKNLEVIYDNDPERKNIKKILNSQFTRLPLYNKNSDKIRGILNVKDVLKNLNKKKKSDLKLIAKDPWFIPETTSVLDQLQEFKKRQRHLAFVVDEYGTLMGIITLEDIIEEIVGDIDDEHDIKIKGARKSKDGKYTISGKVTIRDLWGNLSLSLIFESRLIKSETSSYCLMTSLYICESKRLFSTITSSSYIGFC